MAGRTQPATAFAFVGNVGCIRFPLAIRKASGIKRGDRLAVLVEGPHAVRLEKRDLPDWLPARSPVLTSVEGCSCAEVPEACELPEPDRVTVGWSYVQLEEVLARRLGFLPETPLRLVGEPDQITVSLHPEPRDLEGVARSSCPP